MIPLPVRRALKPPVVLVIVLGHRIVRMVAVRIANRVEHAWSAMGGLLSFLGSLHRRGTQIVETIEGADGLSSARRVAIFSHYDAAGVIRPYVRFYVDELIRAGFAVVFVTNSNRLGPQERSWIRRCALGLRRRNVGRDFGAYKDALTLLGDLSRFDALLLANDSVYGPLSDLPSIIERLDLRSADVWGITDSPQHHPHLQSYFLLLGPRALRSEAFARFWGGVRYVRSKHWVIRRYEIGLSRRLMAEQLTCKTLCPYDVAVASFLTGTDRPGRMSDAENQRMTMIRGLVRRNIPVNPSHFLWETLLVDLRCPFLKRQLLLSNPGKVPFLHRWEHVVRSVGTYDAALITDDLHASLSTADGVAAFLRERAGST